jgi:hypothetical protein
MSRRPLAAMLVATAVLGTAASAQAGAPTRSNGGQDFLVLQVKVAPPRANSAVGLEFDSFAGNDVTGAVPAPNDSTRINDVRLARGFKVNPGAFVQCTVAQANKNQCPRASRVGSGTATADARPTIATPVQASVVAFNGKTSAGKPALLLRAVATLNGSKVPLVLVVEIKPATGGFGPRFVLDNGPLTPGTAPLFGITQLHLVFPVRIARVGRRVVPYLVSASTCRGSWLFEQINTAYSGAREIATDRMPCVR